MTNKIHHYLIALALICIFLILAYAKPQNLKILTESLIKSESNEPLNEEPPTIDLQLLKQMKLYAKKREDKIQQQQEQIQSYQIAQNLAVQSLRLFEQDDNKNMFEISSLKRKIVADQVMIRNALIDVENLRQENVKYSYKVKYYENKVDSIQDVFKKQNISITEKDAIIKELDGIAEDYKSMLKQLVIDPYSHVPKITLKSIVLSAHSDPQINKKGREDPNNSHRRTKIASKTEEFMIKGSMSRNLIDEDVLSFEIVSNSGMSKLVSINQNSDSVYGRVKGNKFVILIPIRKREALYGKFIVKAFFLNREIGRSQPLDLQ